VAVRVVAVTAVEMAVATVVARANSAVTVATAAVTAVIVLPVKTVAANSSLPVHTAPAHPKAKGVDVDVVPVQVSLLALPMNPAHPVHPLVSPTQCVPASI